MKNRRAFIRKAAVAIAAGSLLPAAGWATATRRVQPKRPVLLGELHYADFSELINSYFKIRLPQEGYRMLQLNNVEAGIPQPGLENFSLRFVGLANQALTQGTYRFEHAMLGAIDLFIVPQFTGRRHQYYEAVFNRLLWSAPSGGRHSIMQ